MIMCSFNKNRVATPCIDHHTKMSSVVNSDCKEFYNSTDFTFVFPSVHQHSLNVNIYISIGYCRFTYQLYSLSQPEVGISI